MATSEKKAAADLRRTTSTELLKSVLANPSTSPRSVAKEAEAAGLTPQAYLANSAVIQADALIARLAREEE